MLNMKGTFKHMLAVQGSPSPDSWGSGALFLPQQPLLFSSSERPFWGSSFLQHFLFTSSCAHTLPLPEEQCGIFAVLVVCPVTQLLVLLMRGCISNHALWMISRWLYRICIVQFCHLCGEGAASESCEETSSRAAYEIHSVLRSALQ